MFRVNSTSNQLVRLNVIENGVPQLVDLLPKNFVFTEVHTDQMKQLEKSGVVKVREVRSVNVSAATANVVSDGKLDFNDSKVAKVQKKKK